MSETTEKDFLFSSEKNCSLQKKKKKNPVYEFSRQNTKYKIQKENMKKENRLYFEIQWNWNQCSISCI